MYVIFVQAETQDDPAIALYESLGTKKTAYHFDIEAPPCLSMSSYECAMKSLRLPFGRRNGDVGKAQ